MYNIRLYIEIFQELCHLHIHKSDTIHNRLIRKIFVYSSTRNKKTDACTVYNYCLLVQMLSETAFFLQLLNLEL